MIILVLIGALLFYFALYIVWHQSQGHIESFAGLLKMVEEMAFMPESLFFVIFRGLILVTILYVIGDQLRAFALKIARRRREKAEPMELRYKDPGAGKS